MANVALIAILAEESMADGSSDQISDLTPDVCDARSYERRATVTSNPVEKGSSPSDHRVKAPLLFKMTGSFHETRVGAQTDGASLQGDGDVSAPGSHCLSRVQAWEKADEKDTPLTVYTELGIYENMMIEVFVASRGIGDGDSVPFVAELKQVDIVESESGALTAAEAAKLKVKKRGKSAAKKTAKQNEMDSRLAKEVEAGRVSPEVASGPVDAQAVTDQGSWYDGVGARP
jgi:hypothetical protein